MTSGPAQLSLDLSDSSLYEFQRVLNSADDWRHQVREIIQYLGQLSSIREVEIVQSSTVVAAAKTTGWSDSFFRNWLRVRYSLDDGSDHGQVLTREGPAERLSVDQFAELAAIDTEFAGHEFEEEPGRVVLSPRLAAMFLDAVVLSTRSSDACASLIVDEPSATMGGLCHEWDWRGDQIGGTRRLVQALRSDSEDCGYVRPVSGRPVPRAALWNVSWIRSTDDDIDHVTHGERVSRIEVHVADSLTANGMAEITLGLLNGGERRLSINADWRPKGVLVDGPTTYFNLSNAASVGGQWMSFTI
jgi:hypothetical protein